MHLFGLVFILNDMKRARNNELKSGRKGLGGF